MSRPIYSSIDEALEDVARAYRREPPAPLSPEPAPAPIPEGESLDTIRRQIINKALFPE